MSATVIFLVVGFAVLFALAVLGAMRPVLAIIAAPLAALALGVGGHQYDSPEGIVFAVLAIPSALLGVMVGSSRTNAPVWTKTVALVFLIAVAALGLLAITGVFTGPFCVVAILAGGLFIRFALISRDAVTTLIFSTIGAAMRQNLPLTDALEFEARAHTGKRMRILQSIGNWISQGYPLSESLRRGYSRCPGHALAMVTVAERVHQVPRAVASIEADLIQRAREARKLQPINPAYPLAMLIITFAIVSFLMVLVVPNFERIFSNMGAELPAVTRVLILFSRDQASGVLPLVGIVILGGVSLSLYTKFRPRRPEKPYLLSEGGDWVKWHLPMFRWFERNRSLIQTVSCLHL